MESSRSMDCHYLTVRICHVDSEWMLSPRYLHQSLNLRSFKSDIDLFAIQINRQFSDYVAYRPDP